MNLPEIGHTDDFASNQQLHRLYRMTSAWLLEHGEYVNEQPEGENEGWYQGLPIVDDPSRFAAHIPGTILHGRLPAAAATLRVGTGVLVNYWLAHASKWDDGYMVEPEEVEFDIQQDDASPYAEERLAVIKRATGYESIRVLVMRSRPLNRSKDDAERILQDAQAGMWVRRMPINRQEYVALRAIARNLRKLVR